MKLLLQVSAVLALTSGVASAQMGYTLYSLDSLVSGADLVVRGSVSEVVVHREGDPRMWLDITVKVEETLKGPAARSVTFSIETSKGDERWEQLAKSGQEQLWFLVDSERPVPGESDAAAEFRARHPYKTNRPWYRIRLGEVMDDERLVTRPPPPIFTMHFDLLTERKQILAATRAAVTAEPEGRSDDHFGIRIPRMLAGLTGSSGDANLFVVPADHRLEALAVRLIESPEELLTDASKQAGVRLEQSEGNWSWGEFSANRLRAEGVKVLRDFQSEENIARLRGLLDHPATVGNAGSDRRVYYVRKEAYQMLKEWKVAVEKPVLEE